MSEAGSWAFWPDHEDPKWLAVFVKLKHGQLRWKRGLLASIAGVTLSTIERGDAVRPVSVA
jgi:hypothetical protein